MREEIHSDQRPILPLLQWLDHGSIDLEICADLDGTRNTQNEAGCRLGALTSFSLRYSTHEEQGTDQKAVKYDLILIPEMSFEINNR